MLASGQIDVKPLIADTFALADSIGLRLGADRAAAVALKG
jgi:hypothetical protein